MQRRKHKRLINLRRQTFPFLDNCTHSNKVVHLSLVFLSPFAVSFSKGNYSLQYIYRLNGTSNCSLVALFSALLRDVGVVDAHNLPFVLSFSLFINIFHSPATAHIIEQHLKWKWHVVRSTGNAFISLSSLVTTEILAHWYNDKERRPATGKHV